MANLCIKTPSSAIQVLIFQLLVLRPRPNKQVWWLQTGEGQCGENGENKPGQNQGDAMEPFHKSAMDIGGSVDLKIAFCGHLEPFGASYDSQSPFRTQKIIPIYCLSYAFTISNLD